MSYYPKRHSYSRASSSYHYSSQRYTHGGPRDNFSHRSSASHSHRKNDDFPRSVQFAKRQSTSSKTPGLFPPSSIPKSKSKSTASHSSKRNESRKNANPGNALLQNFNALEQVDLKPYQLCAFSNCNALQNILRFPENPQAGRKSLFVVAQLSTVDEHGCPPAKISKLDHFEHSKLTKDAKYKQVKSHSDTQVISQRCSDNDSSTDSDSDLDSEGPGKSQGCTTTDAVFLKYDFKKRVGNSEKLPICQQREKLIKEIKRNRILIIEGPTGCGKTTQIPQFIIDSCLKGNRCSIVVTQPQRLAASNAAQRVSDERGWELGTLVDFQHKDANRKSHPDTLLKYVTTGTLLQQLISTKSLSSWTHVIIDEVHRRNVETDLLLLLIKKILQDDEHGKEKKTKIILMSATLNTKKLSSYFLIEDPKSKKCIIPEAPVFKIVRSMPFEIQEYFLDDFVNKTKVEQVYQKIKWNSKNNTAKIVDQLYSYAETLISSLDACEMVEQQKQNQAGSQIGEPNFGSVLAFLPGMKEIRELERRLNNKQARLERENSETIPRLNVLVFHSSCTKEEKEKVFAPPEPNQRKVILATNIAESSITIPDIVYVIDFCLTKSEYIDQKTNRSLLRTSWCSVSQCIQRKGRVGRVRDGRVYRMLPKKFFKELEVEAEPDMLKSSLEKVILKIKTLDCGSPKELLKMALDPPSTSCIKRAIVNLKEFGALTLMTTRKEFEPTLNEGRERFYDSCDGDLTFLGRVMATLPLTIHSCKLVMLGFCFGVFHEALIIAASLSSTKSIFLNKKGKDLECYMSKRRWTKEFQSDSIAVLLAYNAWHLEKSKGMSENYLKDWAKSQFIDVDQMRDIEDVVENIQKRFTEGDEFPSLKNFIVNSTSLSKPCTGNAQDIVAPEEVSKETLMLLKIAIAGAFYPNYFVPSSHSKESELKKYQGMDLLSTVCYTKFPAGRIGQLYAKTVSDSLAYSKSIPRVRFSGENILVNFSYENRKLVPISEDLYRAIQKRKLRQQLTLKLLRAQDEKSEYEKCLWRQEMRREYTLCCAAQVSLPSINTRIIDVVVGNVESPGQFWVILLDQLELRKIITKTINENLLNSPISRDSCSLAINALVLAKAPTSFDRRGRYYRGRVDYVDWTMDEALIFFIDSGHSAHIPISDLQPVSPAHDQTVVQGDFTVTTQPGLAMECTLSETRPSVRHGSVWAVEATEKFRFLLDPTISKRLQIKIFAIHQSVIYGEFMAHPRPPKDKNRENVRPFDFNQEMKNLGFADHVEESFLVKKNYEARNRVLKNLLTDPAQIEAYNKEQVAEALDLDFLEPTISKPNNDDDDDGYTCKLQGPFSPLEMKFQSLCRAMRAADIDVDRQSVNSVCFDYRPTAPIFRFLVASTITNNENSKKIIARETTMMPAYPGLLGLVSLLFAPKAKLRTDPLQQKYTGALCGLGSNSDYKNCDSGEPIYPDHDQEIVFDAHLDNNDIQMINQIRFHMNVLLRKNDGVSIGELDAHRRNLKTNMFRLLHKSRVSLQANKRVYSLNAYEWEKTKTNAVDEIPAPDKEFSMKHDDVFGVHSTLVLKEAEEVVEDQRQYFAV